MQLWSSKWSIKDEHKLLSELSGGSAGSASGGGAGATGNGTGSAPGTGASSAGYYEHGGFSASTIPTSTELYDSLGSINTMTQAQTPHLYTPPIGSSIGQFICIFSRLPALVLLSTLRLSVFFAILLAPAQSIELLATPLNRPFLDDPRIDATCTQYTRRRTQNEHFGWGRVNAPSTIDQVRVLNAVASLCFILLTYCSYATGLHRSFRFSS